jgi:peptidyl-tRNA hydrolase
MCDIQLPYWLQAEHLPYGIAIYTLDDEAHLLKIEQELKRKGIAHTAIREQGNALRGELTAIGIEPKKRSELYRHFSSLPLLR